MPALDRLAVPGLASLVMTIAACGGSVTSVSGAVDGSTDAASADSGSPDAPFGDDASSFDAPADAQYLACMDAQGHLDTSMKLCQSDGDCVVRLETTDCCGTILYVGISASRAGDFMTCEAAWDAHFPACGCATGRTGTEDGKMSNPGQDAGAPQVHCTNVTMSGGICLTYTP